MTPKYQVGQKVSITPVMSRSLSPRDAALEPYAGSVGKVSNFYWVNMGTGGGNFYLYTVLVKSGADEKEIVAHEDELTVCIE
ncbi:MAG: hypothetical protein JW790_00770 [Dehalococcoidales bacterium]|jgi:hypothetical protein|nr:hypothetical protein [Dehalococcoidales bacterium]